MLNIVGVLLMLLSGFPGRSLVEQTGRLRVDAAVFMGKIGLGFLLMGFLFQLFSEVF